jgi:hypothetical protein
MIKAFDRTNLRLISADIEAVLKPIAIKYGITFTYKGARFLADNATFKIEGATVGAGGVANTRERDNFKLYASMYGLKETDLDKEITYGGTRYIIKGLNTRRQKYPVVATRIADGKTILLTIEGVKSALLRSASITLNPAPQPNPNFRPTVGPATLADIIGDNEAEGEIQDIEGGQQ